MAYRCPLCLKVLEASDRLGFFCELHSEPPAQIACESGLERRLRCKHRSCRSHSLIRSESAFVKHIGCPARFNYEQFSKDPNPTYKPATGSAVAFDHWELHLLRKVAAESTLREGGELWFPPMLLLATDPSAGHVASRAIVELCGEKGVGKSVLAMQSLDVDSYRRHKKDHEFLIEDYVALDAPGESVSDSAFMRTLAVRSLMAQNLSMAGLVPDATSVGTCNLKTAFIEPMTKPAARRESNNTFLSRAFARLRSEFGFLSSNPSAFASRHHVLMLHDTAGELSKRPVAPYLRNLDASADVVAIFVDAGEIWGAPATGPQPDPNLPGLFTAVNRLRRVREHRLAEGRPHPRCCLVVTKLDLSIAPVAGFIALCEDESDAVAAKRRDTLLAAMAANTHANIRDLAVFVKGDVVDDVFFVWTGGAGQLPAPRTPGLPLFIAWCLGRPIPDVFGA